MVAAVHLQPDVQSRPRERPGRAEVVYDDPKRRARLLRDPPRMRDVARNDVERRLPTEDPVHLTVRAELRVFLLRGADRLVSPFGHGGGGLQLYREPAVGQEADVPPAGYAFLVVPQTDERTSAVPPVADGMTVNRAL